MPYTLPQTMKDKKRKVLEVWVDNPQDMIKTIAEKAGVSEKTFYTYRQDPAFMEQYHLMCKQRFSSLEGKAISTMENLMEDNNFQAAKYVLDYLDYKPVDKIDANVATQDIKINITGDEE